MEKFLNLVLGVLVDKMKKINFTKKQIGEIIRFYEKEVLNPKKISNIFGCSSTPIIKILKENKINMNRSYRKKLQFKNEDFKKKYLLKNEGCFKKGMRKEKHPLYGKHHSKITKQKIAISNSKPNPKCSETKKRLFKEGILKPSFTCFKKGNIPHNFGKTKESYVPLKKAGDNIRKTKNLTQWKEKRGKIAKRKMSASKQGIRLKDWNGFISFEPYDKSFNNKFKRAIRKRDNYICLKCGIHQEKLSRALDVHHIDYNKLLSVPQNCISLCNKCHMITNGNRKHWTKFFQSLLSERYGYQYSETQEIILNYQGGD